MLLHFYFGPKFEDLRVISGCNSMILLWKYKYIKNTLSCGYKDKHSKKNGKKDTAIKKNV